jgi:hypothetical protein
MTPLGGMRSTLMPPILKRSPHRRGSCPDAVTPERRFCSMRPCDVSTPKVVPGPMVFWTLVLEVWALFEGVPKMHDYGARSILRQ